MTEELTEYELFRMKKLHNSLEEDNLSADFSYKGSFPDFTERLESNSARSTPQERMDSLQNEAAINRKQYLDLKSKYLELEKEHRKLIQHCSTLQEKYKVSQEERQKLADELQKRKERQSGTKGKLKQWIAEARQNLKQS